MIKTWIKIIAFMAICVVIARMEKNTDISKKKIKNNVVYMAGASKTYTGKFTAKYPNGELKLCERYKDGWLHGLQEGFYENGNLKYQGKYYHGQKDEEWTFYDEEGNITHTIVYNVGKVVSDSDGVEIQ